MKIPNNIYEVLIDDLCSYCEYQAIDCIHESCDYARYTRDAAHVYKLDSKYWKSK